MENNLSLRQPCFKGKQTRNMPLIRNSSWPLLEMVLCPDRVQFKSNGYPVELFKVTAVKVLKSITAAAVFPPINATSMDIQE